MNYSSRQSENAPRSETKKKKGKRSVGRVVSTLMIVCGLACMAVGVGIMAYDKAAVDEEAAIADQVTESVDGSDGTVADAADAQATDGTEAKAVNFEKARSLTGCDAWIEVPGADISLPVMQASKSNPNYWLRHDLKGRWRVSGTPFIDSRTDADARNALVFGHHLTGIGGMFSNIFDTYYQDKFDSKLANGAVWTTKSGTHRMVALCAARVYETNQDVQRFDFASDQEFRDWLRDLVSKSGAKATNSDAIIEGASHAVLTSCCSSLRSGQPWRCITVFVY